MSGGGAAAVFEEHEEQDENHDENIEQRSISDIPETEFEKEIADFMKSDAWIPAIYVASTTPSASECICIERMWDEISAEAVTSETRCDFDETLGVGFSSSTLAIQAANDYARTKLSWSQKPPQSKADLNVQGRIIGESQKYQRLIGKCTTVDCKFKVVFRLSDGIDGGFAMYKPDCKFDGVHSHAVSVRPEKVANGYRVVERMEQLTSTEKCDIMKHARAGLTPPSVVREILFKSYDKVYCERLILNAMQTARKISARMLDRDTSMNQFYAELEHIKEQGGQWKDSKRGDGTMKTVFIQTKSMRLFASKYHKVVIIDATFSTNKYGLKLVPYLGIDCLGKGQIMGVAYIPTENGTEIGEALEFFGLKNKGSTLITDDHSCYPRLAEEAEMHHLLCSYHFKEEILKACSVLNGDNRGRIAKHLTAAMYESDKFADSDAVEAWFTSLRGESDNPKFIAFINRFHSKKTKILAFFTRQFYTANSYASQRIEKLNHAIKGKGERKIALARFNMFESYERIKYTVANMERKTRLELNTLLDVEWAPFLTQLWDTNQQTWFSGDNILPAATPYDGGIIFNCNMHTVTLPDDGHCQCSCNGYASSLIPCPFMVAACQKHYGHWKKLQHLHPQWRLAEHPWHPYNLPPGPLRVATVLSSDVTVHDNSEHDAYQEVHDNAYAGAVVPSQVWFGTELRQFIERIITNVKNAEDYKLSVAALTVLQYKLEHVAPNAAREPHKVNAHVPRGKINVGTKHPDSDSPAPKPKPKRNRKDESGGSTHGKVGTKNPASDDTAPKQKRSRKDASGQSSAKGAARPSKSAKNRVREVSDAYIRETVRNNGGLRDGLVIEVEPDADAKSKNEKWYMTVVDGRLKNGVTTSSAALCSCRFMKTNSTTIFEDPSGAVRICKVDSILSIVQHTEMFAQTQIRGEMWENARCIFQVRYMNNGACSDSWLDGTQVDSALMRSWVKNRSRDSRKMTLHEYATFPFECYFQTPHLSDAAGSAVCRQGKYNGTSCRDILIKDPNYCICMLEIFAESGAKMKAKDANSIGHLCRFVSLRTWPPPPPPPLHHMHVIIIICRYLSTKVNAKQFYMRACRCTACAC